MTRLYCDECGKNRNHTSKTKISEGKLKIQLITTCSQGHTRIGETEAQVTHSVEKIMIVFASLQNALNLSTKEELKEYLTNAEAELIKYPHR